MWRRVATSAAARQGKSRDVAQPGFVKEAFGLGESQAFVARSAVIGVHGGCVVVGAAVGWVLPVVGHHVTVN